MLKFNSKPVAAHSEVPLADAGELCQLGEHWQAREAARLVATAPDASACYGVSVGSDHDAIARAAQLAETGALVHDPDTLETMGPAAFAARRLQTSLGNIADQVVVVPFADPARTSDITTPWVTYPDLLEAECVTQGDLTYLSLTVNGDPADPRTDDIEGDLPGGWGLHIVDANIAMGDIEALVASQAAAYVD